MKKKYIFAIFSIASLFYFYSSKRVVRSKEKKYPLERKVSSLKNQRKIISKIKPSSSATSLAIQTSRKAPTKTHTENVFKTKTKFDFNIENTPYLLSSSKIKKEKNNFKIQSLKPNQMPLIKNKISKRVGRLSGIISFIFSSSEEIELNTIVEDFGLTPLKKTRLNEKQLWMLRFQEVDVLSEIFKRVANSEIKADLDIIQRKR